jgi:hypothetical protein
MLHAPSYLKSHAVFWEGWLQREWYSLHLGIPKANTIFSNNILAYSGAVALSCLDDATKTCKNIAGFKSLIKLSMKIVAPIKPIFLVNWLYGMHLIVL